QALGNEGHAALVCGLVQIVLPLSGHRCIFLDGEPMRRWMGKIALGQVETHLAELWLSQFGNLQIRVQDRRHISIAIVAAVEELLVLLQATKPFGVVLGGQKEVFSGHYFSSPASRFAFSSSIFNSRTTVAYAGSAYTLW